MSETLDRLKAALADRYAIERVLGAGGMATVYLAEDLKHHRKVAVKVLHPELAAVLGGERFLKEIEVTANLQHPNILALYDSGAADSFLYYVMPFIEGESVRDKLDREKQLGIDETVEITKTVASALDFAHKKGVVHRDIKPENILLQDNIALVADFGIAVAVSTAGGERLTETGLSLGTPSYMSPEQVAGERDLDARSDVYALACVTYEMLAGDPPFVASNVQTVMAKHLTDPVPPLTTARAAVNPTMAAAIVRALGKAPVDRYPTAGAFAAAMVTPVDEEPDGARSIVVLPFANLSPDPENEYFTDGLTEEIIADLSKVRALSVISRTSAMQLKGTEKNVRTIGRELDVRYVLEGSVRKAGNSLRITAQLIDAHTDAHLWAEKYSGTVDDVFDVQERVSREIVAALDVTLTSDEDKRLAHHPIADVRAFELYLQAREELRRYATQRASKLLSHAAEIEGETPPLRALMAWAKVTLVKAGLNRDLRPLDEAETQARALLEAAPDAAYGHALLGYIEYERGHQLQAVQHFNAALDREPNDADALFYLGIAYIAAGQNDQAANTSKRLIACDPLASVAWMLAGSTRWFVGRYEEAPELLLRGLEIDPQNFMLHWCTGYTYASLGEVPEAAKHATWLAESGPEVPYTHQLQALVEAMSGRRERAMEWLAPVDVAPLDAHNKFHLAESFAMADQTDQALDLLERAVDEGFYPYPFIADYCPFLAPLRGTPRFAEISAKAQRLVSDFA